MKNTPIIILGAPRSGTTMLGDILAKHSEVHYMIEPNLIWHHYVNSKSDYFDMRYANKAIEPTKNYFEKELYRSGSKRLLEKTPQNCLRVPFVHRVFPEARFIHVIRNGLESVLSITKYWQTNTYGFKGVRIGQRLKEVSIRQLPKYGVHFLKRLLPKSKVPHVFWGPVLPGMSELINTLSIPEVAALQWRMCVEQAVLYGRSMLSDQYMELRLEDFCEQKLHEILGFALLSPEKPVLEFANERFQKSQTVHRTSEASSYEIESIMRWIQPTTEWLGQSNPNCKL